MPTKILLLMGSLSGAIAVVTGAIAAHALDELSPELRSAFATGVQYHWYHTLALIIMGMIYDMTPNKSKAFSCWHFVSAGLMISGVLLFSGSLYAMPFLTVSWLGPVTPIGGLLLIVSWITLFISIWCRPCRTMTH